MMMYYDDNNVYTNVKAKDFFNLDKSKTASFPSAQVEITICHQTDFEPISFVRIEPKINLKFYLHFYFI